MEHLSEGLEPSMVLCQEHYFGTGSLDQKPLAVPQT